MLPSVARSQLYTLFWALPTLIGVPVIFMTVAYYYINANPTKPAAHRVFPHYTSLNLRPNSNCAGLEARMVDNTQVIRSAAALVESLLNDVALSFDMRYVTRYG